MFSFKYQNNKNNTNTFVQLEMKKCCTTNTSDVEDMKKLSG